MTSRAVSLCSTAWVRNVYIATAPVELRCATAARSAESERRIMSFAGLVERFLLFPSLCVSSKSAL